MENTTSSAKALRDAAIENIKKYCDKTGEDNIKVKNFILNQIDEPNMLLPLELYRQFYNESLSWLEEIKTQ